MPKTSSTPEWVTYPEKDWVTVTPAEAGLDTAKLDGLLSRIDVRGASFGGEDHSGGRWGAVLTRGGYLVHTWGDRHYRFQTASVGKAFVFALIGLAVQDRMIEPDDLISDTWTGRGQLSHPHKYLDEGHHRSLTWRLLAGHKYGTRHYGGFPIEVGYHWKKGPLGLTEEDMAIGLSRDVMEVPA